MRIAFICPVFPPEPAPAGQMARELATTLAAAGHEVSIFTQFPNRPLGKVYPGYKRKPTSIERMSGFEVIRCAHWVLGRDRRPLSRALENLTFGVSSGLNLLLRTRPDVAIVETWPLCALTIALAICRLRRVPSLNYVQDCYPEVLEHTSQIRTDGKLARMLRKWDSKICSDCTRVIAISPGMKALICSTRGIPEKKVAVIQNWVDKRNVPTISKQNNWREELGISPQQFLLLYAGTLGHVSGAEVLVETFKRLKHRPDVILICVGEGVLKSKMQEAASQAEIPNIKFLSVQPIERVTEMHAAADATILTTKAGFPDASVPSKLISYLAAGRPVVCAAHESSTVAEIIRNANAGIVANAGDADSIAQAITFLADHPIEAKQLGINARDCFEDQFTFEAAYERFKDLLDGVDESRLDDRFLPSLSRSETAKRVMPLETNTTGNAETNLELEPFHHRFEELPLTVAYSRQEPTDQRINHEAHDRSGQNPLQ
jgi:colanic acid biosynthesis glycosyl transferase WcaI